MINKQSLLNKLPDNQIEGILGRVLQFPIEIGEHSIRNNQYINYLELYGPNEELLVTDTANYITEFTPELLDKEYKSILVGGLGLGIVPFVSQDFCDIIDVVEINSDVIALSNQLNILSSKVNIIQDDIFLFEPTRTYDIIVIDVKYRPMSDELTDELTLKYLPFVNEGGFIYYPINATSKEQRIFKVER